MTFQQLHYILEVAKTGSVSKAAKSLFVTRPAISACIRSLEEELGFSVFLRTAHGFVPSPKGEMVLEHARSICSAQQQLTAMGQETKPRIEIHVTQYPPVEKATAQLISENRNRRDIAFTVSGRAGPYRRLAAGEIDCVVTRGYEKNIAYPSENIIIEELKKIPVVILLGEKHRLFKKENLTPMDFENEILLDSASLISTRSNLLKKSLPINPDTVLVSAFRGVTQHLLAEGLGYEICLPPSQEYLDTHNVRCIVLEGVYQYLRCAVNTTLPIPSEAKRFLSILQKELQDYRDPEIPETMRPLWMEDGRATSDRA